MSKREDVYAILGFRIYPGSVKRKGAFFFHGRLEKGLTDFWTIFYPAFPKLEKYRWIDYERGVVEEPKHIYEFARRSSDDGEVLIGLAESNPSTTAQLSKMMSAPLFASRTVKACDIIFQNYDGVYWACYARDFSILEVLLPHVDGIKGRVIEATFRETIEVHRQEYLQHMARSSIDTGWFFSNVPEFK